MRTSAGQGQSHRAVGPRAALEAALAAAALLNSGDTLPPRCEVRRSAQGAGRAGGANYTSNIALLLAARTGQNATEVARALSAKLSAAAIWPGTIEEAGGFLNFRLDDKALTEALHTAVRQGDSFGAGDALANQRVLVEFVSADPTGPLPLRAGRAAVAGDALCRLLALQGADVTRECYLNDDVNSSKLRLLGESVASAYGRLFDHELEPPEGVLDGKFIGDVARGIAAAEGNAYLLVPESERTVHFARCAETAAVASQRDTLAAFGVRFDVWSSESALRSEGRVDSALRKLSEGGHTYTSGGALWLASAALGDEADRVLVRSNGAPTYLAADIAYHLFKFERGFDVLLNIWSLEHRQYIERTRTALRAAGCDPARLEVVACAGVRWQSDGVRVARGRDGGVFTQDEALSEVPAPTLRLLLLQAAWDSPVTIEIEEARRDDESNPAYAARLLPARLATLIGAASAEPKLASTAETAVQPAELAPLGDEERAVAALVAAWPDIAREAALLREPHRVALYLGELAAAVRRLLAISRAGDEAGRLLLWQAARVAAVNALAGLGVEADGSF